MQRWRDTAGGRLIWSTAGVRDKLAVLIMSKPSVSTQQRLRRAECSSGARGLARCTTVYPAEGRRTAGILIHETHAAACTQGETSGWRWSRPLPLLPLTVRE